jgi:putative FmdB family regulatory protein
VLVPTYEYECSLCNHHFERKQSFDEEPVAVCPKCQGKARRIINAIPVIFKGSGFYITDSRKGDATSTGTEKKGPVSKGKKKESKK